MVEFEKSDLEILREEVSKDSETKKYTQTVNLEYLL